MCCRADQVPIPDGVEGAGRWADYRYCDLSFETMCKFVESIAATQQDADCVYFTGDVVSHAAWETSKLYNLLLLKQTYYLFKKEFGNILVLPVIGNHEAHPMNM